ncbi:MAG TPA: isoamylase early set domain-containing protein [Acidimicrobiales bacterium]
MIKRAHLGADEVKVTFAVPSTVGTVSVVGDFNGWSPEATPMRSRSNGTRSAVVVLPTGQTYRFRYLAEGGRFFDDDAPDGHEPNGYGETHSLICT